MKRLEEQKQEQEVAETGVTDRENNDEAVARPDLPQGSADTQDKGPDTQA
jgi:hypothetical protein